MMTRQPDFNAIMIESRKKEEREAYELRSHIPDYSDDEDDFY